MKQLRKGDTGGLRSSDKCDALIGDYKGPRVQFGKRLLFDRMTVERADPIPNAGVSNRKAEALASSDPLPPSLISGQTSLGDPTRTLAALRYQRDLNFLPSLHLDVGR